MKLKTVVGEFFVKFRYVEEEVEYPSRFANGHFDARPVMRRGVLCVVETPDKVNGGGRSMCDSRRPFVKFEGRKLAMAKALRQVLPGYHNRHVRAELWFHYLATLGERGIEKALAGAKAFERHAVRRGQPLGWLVQPPFNTLNDELRVQA